MRWEGNFGRGLLPRELASLRAAHPALRFQAGPPQATATHTAEDLATMGLSGIYSVPVDHRFGDWLQTYSGRKFWPLDPRADDVAIEDIAHALANKCRYAGHCLIFYSVAEHAVQVSLHVPEHLALWALLHDAAEAYTADIPKPLKPFIPGWQEIEARVMRAVCDRFGLPHEEPAEVKAADHAILTDEKVALMEDGPPWSHLAPPLGAEIRGLSPMEAKVAFLSRFQALTRGGAVPA